MPSRTRTAVAAVFVLIGIVLMTRGYGRYGEVNTETYEYAKALYSACNLKDVKRLDACETMISEAESADKISAKEVGYLRDIISMARDDQWDDAQAMVRQLMTDQADRW